MRSIRRCRSGDIRGLDALMARHQVQALRVAYLLTGNRMQARRTWCRTASAGLSHHQAFSPGPSFAPWLHGSVTHVARQRLRGSSRREVSLNAPDALSATRRAPLEGRIQSRRPSWQNGGGRCWTHSAALTQKQREAVVLRYYAG